MPLTCGWRSTTLHQLRRIREPDPVEPTAVHADRRVVDADHRGHRLAAGERLIQPLELVASDASGRVAPDMAAQHDDVPAADLGSAAILKAIASECRGHGLGGIVVAGRTQHRPVEPGECAAKIEVCVSTLVFGDVAGHENCIGPDVPPRQGAVQHGTERVRRIDVVELAGLVGEQMRIGEMQ